MVSPVGLAVAAWLVFGQVPGEPLSPTAGSSAAPTSKEAGPPPLAVAPFNAAQAKVHQEAWATRAGVPAGITNSIGMKLVLIPPGEFTMGSPPDESPRRASFERQHRVRITQSLYLGVYEVTQAEYERVTGRNPSAFSPGGEYKDVASALDTSRFPVERVSWEDAVAFCGRLSSLPEEKAAKRMYRLPTEAEWEYACRAGTTTTFHGGMQLTGKEANCNSPESRLRVRSGARPTTVGSYEPNAFGLHDMHGNVGEWCQDWFHWDYYKISPRDDPQGPSQSLTLQRVMRGGSYGDVAPACRAANRAGSFPAGGLTVLGFRVAAVSSAK